ncbi:MAG: SprT-like domain-containing protein [Thiohalorhabdus sp.]
MAQGARASGTTTDSLSVDALQQRVRTLVEERLTQAERHFARKIPRPEIRFDLTGKTAGQAERGGAFVRFNTVLLRENPEDFLARTVPHEVAHVVVARVYGPATRPHGREWKAVMRDLFGADPTRCHQYDVTNAARRTQAHYPLACGCMTHHVTARLVAQVVRNPGSRICRKCREPLAPADAATRQVGKEYGKGRPARKKAASGRQRRFAYACPGCGQDLWLSTTRHNRIQRDGTRYQSGCCRAPFGTEAFTGRQA